MVHFSRRWGNAAEGGNTALRSWTSCHPFPLEGWTFLVYGYYLFVRPSSRSFFPFCSFFRGVFDANDGVVVPIPLVGI